MSSKRENVVDVRYIPLDDQSAKLEVFVQMDDEQFETIGNMDEAVMVMAALQQLYMTAVMNTSQAGVDQLLEGTAVALQAQLDMEAESLPVPGGTAFDPEDDEKE